MSHILFFFFFSFLSNSTRLYIFYLVSRSLCFYSKVMFRCFNTPFCLSARFFFSLTQHTHTKHLTLVAGLCQMFEKQANIRQANTWSLKIHSFSQCCYHLTGEFRSNTDTTFVSHYLFFFTQLKLWIVTCCWKKKVCNSSICVFVVLVVCFLSKSHFTFQCSLATSVTLVEWMALWDYSSTGIFFKFDFKLN